MAPAMVKTDEGLKNIISRWQGTAADVTTQYAKGLRARMSVTRQHVLDDHKWKIFCTSW